MRTIDTPDLPVPAIGIDTGTDVAATSVQNGPYVFVIVIGDANGRWREQFQKCCSASCQRFRECLTRCGIDLSSRVPSIGSGGPVVMGFVVMQAWKFCMACLLLIPKWLACVLAGKAFANVHAGLCFWSTGLWLLPGFPQHLSFQQLGWERHALMSTWCEMLWWTFQCMCTQKGWSLGLLIGQH
jgi:hypothetical protein